MKTAKCLSMGTRTLGWIVFLSLGFIIPYAYGQDRPVSAQAKEDPNAKTGKDFTIRVAVEEVRLDTVVLDRKGRQIADLKTEDFEIYQDDVPQTVLSSVYITNQTEPSAKPALPRKDSKAVPPTPTPQLEMDNVRRVLVFIVDDISMGFENIHHSRLALTNFVEKQMQPGDMVAILRTSYGNSILQMFLSDKQQLLARIKEIRWGSGAGRDLQNASWGTGDATDNLYSIFDSQITTIRYGIRALRNMPGRKALLMMSAQTSFPGMISKDLRTENPIDYEFLYRKAYNRLADDALRAGVVFHMMDIRGLEAPFASPFPGSGASYDSISARFMQPLNPLPQKTGGLFLRDSNFFVDGIGEVNDALKGYYILSYAPPPTTFKSNRKEIFHRVKIKVKRRGTTVYSRDGFYGVTANAEEAAMAQNPLREAIFSPFQHKDLKVNLASGYMDDPKAGYLLRSWLHLDAENVTIIEKKDEGHFISLETVCVTSDINGYIRDSSIMKYEFRIKEENLSWIKEHGIRFSLFLPVKNPGAYYVRVAVKDQVSGKVGSAYQYIDIPNLKKGRLALSNIFVINRDDEAAWLRTGITKENSQYFLTPVLQRDESRSPALRNYLPRDNFKYMTVVYNSNPKKGEKPDLESQSILYKDGLELYKSESQIVKFDGVRDFIRIPILKKLQLGDALQTGDYVLQFFVTDKRILRKDRVAAQTLNFQISGK